MRNSNAVGSGDHHRISPTARIVGYFRSFSDIPYAKEASKTLRGEEAARQMYQDDLDLVTRFSGPLMEARYKCFKRFIDAHSNVLELAVGTSVERGLSISDDPNKFYIGTDLPEMIKESKAFLKKISKKRRTNHHLEAANVLSYEELNAAANHLGVRRDVLIINEGLWMYLTAEEQVVCAENIRRILEHYGGKWVTPDIIDSESRKQLISSLGPEMSFAIPRMMRGVANLTGRDLENNFFANRQDAIRFFQTSGFEVNQYPLVDNLGSLTSITKLWGERERGFYEPALKQRLVWVMSLR